jgi:sec-independent protein translocase protein TatC
MLDDREEQRAADPDEGGPVKSFLEHLEDLRWVLIKSAAAIGIATLACLLGGNVVVGVIKWPLTRAKIHYSGTNQVVFARFGTNRIGTFRLNSDEQQSLRLGTNRFAAIQVELGSDQNLKWHLDTDPAAVKEAQRLDVALLNLSPAGGFIIAFQVAIYGGIALASPFVLYFVANFVFPALKLKERRYIYRGVFYGGGLFVIGVAFCYFILMPVALSASQLYSQWLGFGAYQWRAEEYISFVCKFMLGMGLGFELPVVLLVLVKIGILDYTILRKMWRYMVVINLVLGALLTTPEVLTQVLMAGPLYLLYEVTVWIAWYWEQPDRAKARLRVLKVGLAVAAAGALLWAGWHYGWAWLRTR